MNTTTFDLILYYFELGFTHVIPLGFDHILFILCLYFLNSTLKSVFYQCLVFTFAHSITLVLTASNFIIPNSSIIEPIIALTILYAAVENILKTKLNYWRIFVVFLFGLIHGMGFANALKEIDIPSSHFLSSLISFNVGVEIGQISIILLAYLLIGKWFSSKEWYKDRIVYPISTIISCIAIYWTIERILLI